jgi:hypothetical protein
MAGITGELRPFRIVGKTAPSEMARRGFASRKSSSAGHAERPPRPNTHRDPNTHREIEAGRDQSQSALFEKVTLVFVGLEQTKSGLLLAYPPPSVTDLAASQPLSLQSVHHST